MLLLKLALSSFAILLVGGCIWFATTVKLFETDKQIFTTDATAFYFEEVGCYIKLPEEAHIQTLTKEHAFVDRTYVIEFTLPNTRTPERWLKEIWNTNRFAPNSREYDFKYSAYHADQADPSRSWKVSKEHHGYRELCYEQHRGVYVAVVDTD